MKLLAGVLIVVFAAGIYYVTQKKAEALARQQAAQKDFEAYDRCTAGNDEAHQNEINAGRGGPENEKRWQRARAYCRVNLGESPQQIGKDLDAVGLGTK